MHESFTRKARMDAQRKIRQRSPARQLEEQLLAIDKHASFVTDRLATYGVGFRLFLPDTPGHIFSLVESWDR